MGDAPHGLLLSVTSRDHSTGDKDSAAGRVAAVLIITELLPRTMFSLPSARPPSTPEPRGFFDATEPGFRAATEEQQTSLAHSHIRGGAQNTRAWLTPATSLQ